MTIKEEVLEELDLKANNIDAKLFSLAKIEDAIDLTTQKTLERVEKQIKELSRDRGTYYYDLIEAIKKLKEEKS